MPIDFTQLAPAIGVLTLIASAITAKRVDAGTATRVAELATSTNLAFAALACFGAYTGFWQADETGALALFRIDGLSATMFALVSFIGFIVVRYSRNYLAGDAGQPVFLSRLCLTIAAVTTLVTAGDLIVLLGAWISTSFALHGLLVFRGKRAKAVLAAQKKFIVARIGDACLAAAVFLLIQAFDTSNIGLIIAEAKSAKLLGAVPEGVGFAAVMIALAAALKSAQFPTHGWLTEVMETPTPVSALLHAGIVNAGGFLVIRLADVMLLNLPAMHFLAILGGFTALFGSIVMLTQSSIKVSLAYSTVAQMGFMLLQCGLGAFSAATLHLVAHSLYKAHSFLASGRTVNSISKASATKRATASWRVASQFFAAILVYGVVAAFFKDAIDESAATITLGAIFVMGAFVFMSAAPSRGVAIVQNLVVVTLASVSYFTLQAIMIVILGESTPTPPAPDAFAWFVMALTIASFGGVALAQIAPRLFGFHKPSPLMRAAYVHASNGLYANAIFNRLVETARGRRNAQS